MEWTLDEFYADGGTSSFADRVSAALGVHRSQVKVVAVYYGSVNVQYVITALPDEEYYEESSLTAGLTAEEIAAIDIDTLVYEFENSLADLVTSNAIDFGAEVLSADVGGSVELVATTTSSVASYTNAAGGAGSSSEAGGFSATEAIASFSLLMAPTVMVLARENELVELLGELYNSMTDPEEQEEENDEDDFEITADHGDHSIFWRNITNFKQNFSFMTN